MSTNLFHFMFQHFMQLIFFRQHSQLLLFYSPRKNVKKSTPRMRKRHSLDQNSMRNRAYFASWATAKKNNLGHQKKINKQMEIKQFNGKQTKTKLKCSRASIEENVANMRTNTLTNNIQVWNSTFLFIALNIYNI